MLKYILKYLSIYANAVLKICLFCFVCFEVLRPSQPTGVMSSAVSFTGQV